jgi:hypothetical protein
MHRGDPVETLAARGKSWRSPLRSTDSARKWTGKAHRKPESPETRGANGAVAVRVGRDAVGQVKQAHSDSSGRGGVQPGWNVVQHLHAFDAIIEGPAIMAVEVYTP